MRSSLWVGGGLIGATGVLVACSHLAIGTGSVDMPDAATQDAVAHNDPPTSATTIGDAASSDAASTTSADSAATVSTERLIAHYTFDENIGPYVYGSNGAGTPAYVAGGAKFGPGKVGGALHFNGTDTEVQIGTLGTVEDWSVAFWINPDTSDIRAILDFNARNPELGPYIFQSLVPSGAYLGMNVGDNQRLIPGDNFVLGGFVPQRWHHVAIAFGGGSMSFYMNGKQTFAFKGANAPTRFSNVVLGISTSMRGSHYTGWLDDLRVYGRALAAEEVTNLVLGM
jgi:hypothetical protein